MKYIILFIALFALTRADSDTPVWVADYSDFENQFSQWQTNATTSVPVVIDEDGSKVLHFNGTPTRYNGFVSESINAPSGHYYIAIDFKGEKDKRTGGYIGYERSDQPNVQRTLGLDQKINMEFSQIFRFNQTGEWAIYLAYIEVPAGVTIKLILEKGSYFMTEDNNYDAYFRSIKVYDYDLCGDSCPAADEGQKIYQLGYYSFVFFNNELQYQIFGDVALEDGDSSKAKFTMQYPHNPLCCVKPAFYLLDKDGSVSEDFLPTYSAKSDLDFDNSVINDKWEYSFTMSDIENLNCATEETTNSDGNAAVMHTCDIQMHFYYDYDESFTNKQAEYDYSSKNSQAIFKSKFYVIIYKEEETFFNSFIKTLEVDALCTGICKLDMSLTLDLFYKLQKTDTTYISAEDTLATGSEVTLTWGDYVYFKITSDPSDYDLDLMKVVITTESDTVSFGDMFISSFIQDKTTSTQGELTFGMMISGEAGLTKGKKFNLQFLTESTAASRRLLADELPNAGVSGSVDFQAGETDDEDSENKEDDDNFAGKLSFGFLAMLLLLIIA